MGDKGQAQTQRARRSAQPLDDRMRHLKNAVNPNSPEIQRKAKRYEHKLRRILKLAARQYPRPTPELAQLYKSAVVDGIRPSGASRTAVVTFKGPSLRGSLLESFEWSTLDEMSEGDIAEVLSWAVRDVLAQAQ